MIDVSNQNQFSFANPRVEDYQSATKDAFESGREDDHKIVTLIRRASLDYGYYKQGKGEHKDDFSTSSNLLWKNKGFSSAGSTPMQYYSTLRAQEIARYRQEMMDLVRGMPESAYELSFRDMVETPRLVKKVEEAAQRRQEGTNNKADKATNKSKGTRRLPRNDTMNGLFLKTFVPVLGGGKMKRSRSNSSAKVSPKSEENEFGDQEKSNSKSSYETSSRSTSRSSRRKMMSGCYAFFFTKKSKSKETSKEFVE
ncbi:uncharacterized protein LOC122024152 [Zingiber officinale]|uniref:uncharacterized protein LOC122024152 n=1 Tax=Zingiber officinale TaxID=94328 RepID=UPI001C4A88BB|nr:uncharacterized protein LOC122024152 [Zingiber officinale]